MKKRLKTAIGVVLDESGSMGVRQKETIDLFNEYFEEIQEADPTATVTVAKFSGKEWSIGGGKSIRYHSKRTPIKDLPYLDRHNYVPNGSTPLYDAIGSTINELSKQRADRYLLVILTDGQENTSREFTLSSVNKLIARKEATEKWTIVHLGVSADEWEREQQWQFAQSIGRAKGQFRAPDASPALYYAQTSSNLNSSTTNFLRSTETASTDFFDSSQEETFDVDKVIQDISST